MRLIKFFVYCFKIFIEIKSNVRRNRTLLSIYFFFHKVFFIMATFFNLGLQLQSIHPLNFKAKNQLLNMYFIILSKVIVITSSSSIIFFVTSSLLIISSLLIFSTSFFWSFLLISLNLTKFKFTYALYSYLISSTTTGFSTTFS